MRPAKSGDDCGAGSLGKKQAHRTGNHPEAHGTNYNPPSEGSLHLDCPISPLTVFVVERNHSLYSASGQ